MSSQFLELSISKLKRSKASFLFWFLTENLDRISYTRLNLKTWELLVWDTWSFFHHLLLSVIKYLLTSLLLPICLISWCLRGNQKFIVTYLNLFFSCGCKLCANGLLYIGNRDSNFLTLLLLSLMERDFFVNMILRMLTIL